MLYQIQGQVLVASKPDRSGTTWTLSRQMPTFFLDSGIQGIISEQHAESIANSMFERFPGVIESQMLAFRCEP